MKLIVGLGNPGKEYSITRHNVGFIILDSYANSHNLSFNKTKFGGLFCETLINEEKVLLLKPQQYINLSGEVIRKFVDYYKIDVEDMLIVVDDINLPFGNIKLKYQGSCGGHNGLRNIEQELNTKNYKRLKIGISKNSNYDMKEYVLSKFTKEEKEHLNKTCNLCLQIVEDFLILDFDNLMNKYNVKVKNNE